MELQLLRAHFAHVEDGLSAVRMLYRNVRTTDDAERQIDVKKSGSNCTECISDTQQKTSSHCHRTTTELVTELASYQSYNDNTTRSLIRN